MGWKTETGEDLTINIPSKLNNTERGLQNTFLHTCDSILTQRDPLKRFSIDYQRRDENPLVNAVKLTKSSKMWPLCSHSRQRSWPRKSSLCYRKQLEEEHGDGPSFNNCFRGPLATSSCTSFCRHRYFAVIITRLALWTQRRRRSSSSPSYSYLSAAPSSSSGTTTESNWRTRQKRQWCLIKSTIATTTDDAFLFFFFSFCRAGADYCLSAAAKCFASPRTASDCNHRGGRQQTPSSAQERSISNNLLDDYCDKKEHTFIYVILMPGQTP